MSGFSCYSDFSQSGLDGIVCRRGECRHAFFERRADAFGKVGIEDTFDDRGVFERELLGPADIYLHSGGQYEWDSCAPVAVALAHGLHASRIDGSPLVYNQAEVYMPDLLICRKEHAAMVLTAVADLSRTTPR